LLFGPLEPEPSRDVLEKKLYKWLDIFLAKSIMLCSFGSDIFVNDDQIREVGSGLELSGLPFISVLNFPSDVFAQSELDIIVPKEFLERVNNRAMVHNGWFQQKLVLKHPSVGWYVCHARFSFVIEAMVNECQLVLLPLKGDQFVNSKLVANDLEGGVEVNRREKDGYFHKDGVVK